MGLRYPYSAVLHTPRISRGAPQGIFIPLLIVHCDAPHSRLCNCKQVEGRPRCTAATAAPTAPGSPPPACGVTRPPGPTPAAPAPAAPGNRHPAPAVPHPPGSGPGGTAQRRPPLLAARPARPAAPAVVVGVAAAAAPPTPARRPPCTTASRRHITATPGTWRAPAAVVAAAAVARETPRPNSPRHMVGRGCWCWGTGRGRCPRVCPWTRPPWC
jgi:hypothetical protein